MDALGIGEIGTSIDPTIRLTTLIPGPQLYQTEHGAVQAADSNLIRDSSAAADDRVETFKTGDNDGQ